jgi:hypothetical protein
MADSPHLSDDDHRAEVIKRAQDKDRAGIGKPGVESASGRDRSHDELPRNFGTNANDADVDSVAPPRDHMQGSRVGPSGDPTGSIDDERR